MRESRDQEEATYGAAFKGKDMWQARHRLSAWTAAARVRPRAGCRPRLAHAAAAAQSRRLCPPLCDPRYCCLPGSPVRGIF